MNKNKENSIRARLTVYGHGEMSDKEFIFFKKWVMTIAGEMKTHKRGELSKLFRSTLYKSTSDVASGKKRK